MHYALCEIWMSLKPCFEIMSSEGPKVFVFIYPYLRSEKETAIGKWLINIPT